MLHCSRMGRGWLRWVSLAVLALGCGGSSGSEPAGVDAGSRPRVVQQGNAPWEQRGAFGVGHAIFAIADGDRKLTVQAWYPSREVSADTPIEDLVVDPTDHATMMRLLDGKPCVRRRVASTRDLAPAEGTFPLVLYSHCHGCVRFSSAAIAERLASHGFAVLAPDHTGNTVFDAERGTNAPLDREFLARRAADVEAVLDAALGPGSPALPAVLRGRFDPGAVAMFGHSYGAATTGLVLARDARVRAGVAIAAPMESDLLPPAKMSEIHAPALFLLAREDNSITEIGNNVIRANFRTGNPPLHLVEIEDAGHWSFSDIAGLTPSLAAGCGSATRQTDGSDFDYLENESARALAAAYVTAFFLGYLRGDARARSFLAETHASGLVTASAR